MRWTSTNTDLFYINNVSYVGASGSAQVSSVGDYTGTVFGAGGSASCPAVLSGPNQCVAKAFACNPASGNLVNNCGEVTACPLGCSAITNTCNESCTPQNVCNAAGTSIVNSCTGATVKNCTSAGQICSAAVCVPPPVTFVPFPAIDPNSNPFTASGHLEARPAVVRVGETTNLYWNVVNVASCTVTGSNGDGTSASATGPWTTLASGAPGKVSTGIMNQTIYTLFCRALSGAAPATIQESVIVNVVPSFEEI